MTKSTLTLLFCFLCSAAVAQTNAEAYKLGVEGVLKVDNGEYKEGIGLLKKARNLEPQDYDFAFEIGKAYLKSGNPKMAEKYLFPLQYHAQVQADLYLLLAQCYFELDEKKKTPNPDRKKELDALRYGLQKLPGEGVLYLELGRRNIEMEKPVEALVVLESGIKNAPNFAENYYWAAKLLIAADNHLWAWLYAEVCFNQTDDIDLKRSAAMIVSESSNIVFAGKWKADPEKLDQDVQFAFANKCVESLDIEFDNQLLKRQCLLENFKGSALSITPILARQNLIIGKGWYSAYIWSILQESDKESFLKWIPENAVEFDEFRNWSYWNPLVLKAPIKRLNP